MEREFSWQSQARYQAWASKQVKPSASKPIERQIEEFEVANDRSEASLAERAS